MKKLLPAILFWVLLLTACTPNLPGVVTLTPASPAVSPTQPGLATPAPEAQANPSLTAPPLPPVAVPPSLTPAPPDLPPSDLSSAIQDISYTIEVIFDYQNKTMLIEQEIAFTNHSGNPLTSIELAVEPNRQPGVFHLNHLSMDDVPINDYHLERHRLVFDTPAPMPHQSRASLFLGYKLALPLIEQGDPNLIRPQIFGYTARQINLTDWYPMLVPFDPLSGWVLADPWYFGEHLTYPLADFEVHLSFSDPLNVPLVAASADEAQASENGTRYILKRGRTFAFAMGQTLQSVSAEVNGILVTSYYYPGFEAPAQAVLETSLKAVQTYSELIGPYPHSALAAVQGDFNDGMEFGSLYYLSNAFYNLYDHTPANYLVMVAAHETCHQWWFGAVANDQSQNPWLDETLSTYCERLFYEKNYPDSLSWWQSARIDFFQPEGKIDGPVYSYEGFTPYTNATYRQGARFLQELRERLGDEAFFAFLQDYYAQMNGKIAVPADFFRVLETHATTDISDILQKYFK